MRDARYEMRDVVGMCMILCVFMNEICMENGLFICNGVRLRRLVPFALIYC